MSLARMPNYEAGLCLNLFMEFIVGIVLFIVLLIVGLLLIKWAEYKTLQRAISIADKSSNFIKTLEGKPTGYKTIEMREVINTLQHASWSGKKHLDTKGSSEL